MTSFLSSLQSPPRSALAKTSALVLVELAQCVLDVPHLDWLVLPRRPDMGKLALRKRENLSHLAHCSVTAVALAELAAVKTVQSADGPRTCVRPGVDVTCVAQKIRVAKIRDNLVCCEATEERELLGPVPGLLKTALGLAGEKPLRS